MSAAVGATVGDWRPDILGEGYEQARIELGPDPDGEGGDVHAVLVRRVVRPEETVTGAVLFVHGFSDYFFQTGLADHCAARGLAFHALDLRKCGRAREPHQTAHYASDLALYDTELETALATIAADHPDVPVVVMGHSTGGLVLPLWLDRRRREDRVAPVVGQVLNSPWFDLQGKPVMRGPVTQVLRAVARVQPLRRLDLPVSTVYGDALHVSGRGEWDYDLALRPLAGFPITVGWLNAVRRGHAALHRGLDVGVPSLVLRSDRTSFSRRVTEVTDRSDNILDVQQIARWAGCLGDETHVVPVAGARHDVFLSLAEPRAAAYAALDRWLDVHLPADLPTA